MHPVCGTGIKQSPIDLDTDIRSTDTLEIQLYGYSKVDQPKLKADLNYQFDIAAMPWSGTAKFTIREGDEAQTSYDLKPVNFHFHSPSEHTIDGKHK